MTLRNTAMVHIDSEVEVTGRMVERGNIPPYAVLNFDTQVSLFFDDVPSIRASIDTLTNLAKAFEDHLAADVAPVATDRAETEPCERGTIGCSVNHSAIVSKGESACATW